jgi:hypothetical protein
MQSARVSTTAGALIATAAPKQSSPQPLPPRQSETRIKASKRPDKAITREGAHTPAPRPEEPVTAQPEPATSTSTPPGQERAGQSERRGVLLPGGRSPREALQAAWYAAHDAECEARILRTELDRQEERLERRARAALATLNNALTGQLAPGETREQAIRRAAKRLERALAGYREDRFNIIGARRRARKSAGEAALLLEFLAHAARKGGLGL